MLYGRNLTDPGADSNGSGKSGILEGITLALTGKICRDVNRDDFINDDSESCYVELRMEKSSGELNDLTIKRWLYRKKASRLELWENGELNSEMTSVNEANSRIYELIGISREDLLHFFIIGQNTNHSFLTAGDSEQRDIISRLTNADPILEKIDELKAKKKLSDALVYELDSSVQKFDNFIELTKESIKDEKSNGNKEAEERIEAIKGDIGDHEDLVASNHRKIGQKNVLIESHKKQIKLAQEKLVDLTEVEDKLERVNKSRRMNSKWLSECRDEMSKLERVLAGKTTCPKCSHEWNEGEDINVSEIPDAIKDLKKLESTYKIKIQKLNKKRDVLLPQLNANDEVEQEIKDLKSEIDELETEVGRLNRTNKSRGGEIDSLKKTIERIEKEMNDNSKLKNLMKKLAEYKASKKAENKKLETARVDSEKYDFWIYHFSKKGFLTYLTNQSIKTIEGMTNSYLQKFNSDLKVNIEGYKVLKNNDIREKISVSIIRNGRNIGSFERYSGGEKGRINLACIAGLQKLMNMSISDGGLNFLGLDEVFEGLDTTGQKDVLKILETIGVTTMVVSHRVDSIGSDNEVYIEKVNGISNIVSNG